MEAEESPSWEDVRVAISEVDGAEFGLKAVLEGHRSPDGDQATVTLRGVVAAMQQLHEENERLRQLEASTGAAWQDVRVPISGGVLGDDVDWKARLAESGIEADREGVVLSDLLTLVRRLGAENSQLRTHVDEPERDRGLPAVLEEAKVLLESGVFGDGVDWRSLLERHRLAVDDHDRVAVADLVALLARLDAENRRLRETGDADVLSSSQRGPARPTRAAKDDLSVLEDVLIPIKDGVLSNQLDWAAILTESNLDPVQSWITLSDLIGVVKRVRGELEARDAEVKTTHRRFEESLGSVKAELGEEQRVRNSWQQRAADLEKQADHYRTKLERALAEVRQWQDACRKMEKEEAAKMAAVRDEMRREEERWRQLETECAAVKEELTSVAAEREAWRQAETRIDELAVERREVKAKLEACEVALQAKAEAIERAQERMAVLESELEGRGSDQQALLGRTRSLEAEIAHLLAEAATARELVARLEAASERLREECGQLRHVAAMADGKDVLERQLEEIKAQLERSHAVVAEETKRRTFAERVAAERDDQLRTLVGEREALVRTLKDGGELVQRLQDDKRRLDEKADKHKNDIKLLKKQVQLEKSYKVKTKRACDELKEKAKEAKAKWREAQTMVETLKEQLSRAQQQHPLNGSFDESTDSQIEDYKQRLATMEGQLHLYEAQQQQTRVELEAVLREREQLTALHQQNSQAYEERLQESQRELQSIRQECHRLNKEKFQLKSEITKLRATLQTAAESKSSPGHSEVSVDLSDIEKILSETQPKTPDFNPMESLQECLQSLKEQMTTLQQQMKDPT